MRHIKIVLITTLFLSYSPFASAQVDLLWNLFTGDIKGIVIDGIKDAIVSTARDGARGDITAETDNKVISEAAATARKRGVATAISNKNGVNIENINSVLSQVQSDYANQMLVARTKISSTSGGSLMFKNIANGMSSICSSNVIDSKMKTNAFGGHPKATDAEKLRFMFGDSIATILCEELTKEQCVTFLNDAITQPEFRNAIRQRPSLIKSYVQTYNSSLSNDVVFLSYLDGDAMRYFDNNVMLKNHVTVLPIPELSFSGNKEVVVKYNGSIVAIMSNETIKVENRDFLNYALLPNKKYLVDGFAYHTDNLGRVFKVEGRTYENKSAIKNKNLTKTFVHARKMYSNKTNIKEDATYIIPMEYGGVTYGINAIPLTKEQCDAQKKYYKDAKKTNKGYGFHVQTVLKYEGASETPISISF